MDLEETTFIRKLYACGEPTCLGVEWLMEYIESREGWQSGCMQGGTRLMDSKRTSIALSLAQGLSQSDRVGPSILSTHAIGGKKLN